MLKTENHIILLFNIYVSNILYLITISEHVPMLSYLLMLHQFKVNRVILKRLLSTFQPTGSIIILVYL